MGNYKTRHHLIPKIRKRKKNYRQDQAELYVDTTLKLWRDKHDAWHLLFKDMTLDEIIKCLERVRWLCLKKQARELRKTPVATAA